MGSTCTAELPCALPAGLEDAVGGVAHDAVRVERQPLERGPGGQRVGQSERLDGRSVTNCSSKGREIPAFFYIEI